MTVARRRHSPKRPRAGGAGALALDEAEQKRAADAAAAANTPWARLIEAPQLALGLWHADLEAAVAVAVTAAAAADAASEAAAAARARRPSSSGGGGATYLRSDVAVERLQLSSAPSSPSRPFSSASRAGAARPASSASLVATGGGGASAAVLSLRACSSERDGRTDVAVLEALMFDEARGL